ncbi:MAG TPA: ABC transporter permease, partial [Roseiflexaceae bacterium]|nr:ABC transporter permease [Roseiflexaceae bacterium]
AIHEVDLIVTQRNGAAFPASVAAELRNMPGVAEVTPVLERTLRLPAVATIATNDGAPITSLTINGWDPTSAAAVIPLHPVAGRWLDAGDQYGAMVRTSFTRRTGLGVGDTLQLPAANGMLTVTIVGVLQERPVFGDEEIALTLPTAQTLFNMPGQINAMAGQFDDDMPADQLRATLLAHLGDSYQIGNVSAGSSTWRSALQIGELTFTLFGVLALAMGGFIMLNTFRTSIAERRRDIGMLRAIGADRRTLVLVVLTESLILGIAGTLLGMLLGFLLVTILVAAISPTWESFFGVPLGNPGFGMPLFAMSIGLGLGVPLLSGLLPALAAARITPLAALRPVIHEHIGRPALGRLFLGLAGMLAALAIFAAGQATLAMPAALLLLGGLIIVAPLLVVPTARLLRRQLQLAFPGEAELARGNLTRHPERAAVTASTIMISLAILVALAGLTSTFTSGLMGYLERSMRADYLLLPEALVLGQGNVEAGPQLAERMRLIPGIAEVTTLRHGTAQLADDSVQVIGIDPATYPRLAGLIFTSGDEQQAYARLAAGDAIIMNGILASQQQLHIGQQVTLTTPAGERTFEIVGIGIDYLNARQATVYLPHAELAASFRQENDALLMANRTPTADAALVEAALRDLTREYPAFSLLAFEQWRASQLAANQTRSNILYVLMVLLALPSLVALANTLAINVLERTREIGVLRAIGAARSQVMRLIIAESLLLTSLGIAGGLVAGSALGFAIVGALGLGGLPFDYPFPSGGVVLTIFAGLAIGVLAALPPARRAAQIAIVAALRYE